MYSGSVLTDNLYNDLGVMVGSNKLLLLLEAQSLWTVNILIRILLYLAQSCHEYFERTSQSLYKSTKVIYESDTGDIINNTLFSVKFLMNRESCMG